MTVRPLRPADLAAVMTVQDEAYPDVGHDSLEVFADKLTIFPRGCWGAWEDARLAGYLFSHPWRAWQATTLDEPLHLPERPDCYYLHDLAVASWAQGRGAARALVEAALELARVLKLPCQALVAVHRSQPFWARFGFEDATDPPASLVKKLAEYSPDATYMIRLDMFAQS